jgi:hypothetical protein
VQKPTITERHPRTVWKALLAEHEKCVAATEPPIGLLALLAPRAQYDVTRPRVGINAIRIGGKCLDAARHQLAPTASRAFYQTPNL